jgi:ABC-type transporter Mla subunit MlaD
MSNATLDALAAAVTNIETVADSAIALINGIAASVQAAVDAALAGGATAADLAPVQAEVDSLNAKATDLAAAVTANTPAPPPATFKKK